jgi:hypothetical protein
MAQASGTNENVMAASRNGIHLAASSPCLRDPVDGGAERKIQDRRTPQAATRERHFNPPVNP